jgi:peptidoglycan/LPS O-acetylase OafA/YrhL
LDVIRFLAFLLVFAHHVLPRADDPSVVRLIGRFSPVLYAVSDACGFGLSLFFTLSAFLICELLLREREAKGTIAAKQFYIRRILRIWPLYYFALALGLVFAWMPGGDHLAINDLGWFAIFMGAWFTALHNWLHNPVSPLWSISVEEQFYVVAPWVVKYFSRGALYGFCAFVTLVSNAWLYYLGHVHASNVRIWADSFVQFECFAFGIFLCLVLHGRSARLSPWQRLALIALSGSCWFLSSYALHYEFILPSENPGSWPLIGGYALGALGSVLLLIGFLGVAPHVLPAWAIYLGRISFGLYVYHEFALGMVRNLPIKALLLHLLHKPSLSAPLGAALSVVSSLALTFILAALSYRYLETPFLKMKNRHAVIQSQPMPGSE